VCGEHDALDPNLIRRHGSSPRVWGTSKKVSLYQYVVRFIPTCVGNIRMETGDETDDAVHPHVCGEHTTCPYFQRTLNGSSPRVWGTFPRAATRATRKSVHPHVCGEHARNTARPGTLNGSSPRVWGTCLYQHRAPQKNRFIPTCVGNILMTPYS